MRPAHFRPDAEDRVGTADQEREFRFRRRRIRAMGAWGDDVGRCRPGEKSSCATPRVSRLTFLRNEVPLVRIEIGFELASDSNQTRFIQLDRTAGSTNSSA